MTEAAYTLNYPPKIVFGAGALDELSDYLPEKSSILLVTGSHLRETPQFARIEQLLSSFEVRHISGILAEPPLEDVDKLLQAGRESDCDAVVAIGGGSVIDAAKAAAAIIPLDGITRDYFFGRKTITCKGLFFVAIPTTAGTGAEITKNSVLTDTETKIKQSIRHPLMTADVAIVDPELTRSASPSLVAASGLDAFTQAVESFTTLKANAVTRSLARTAVAQIYRSLPVVFRDPDDAPARLALTEGSMLSAMSFSQSGLGAVHGLAHPLGSLLSIPHGVTCAVLLVPVLKLNRVAAADDYADLARACQCGDSADDFIKGVEELVRELAIPADFGYYGLAENHYPFVIENCRSNSMKGNPLNLSDEDIHHLLERLT